MIFWYMGLKFEVLCNEIFVLTFDISKYSYINFLVYEVDLKSMRLKLRKIRFHERIREVCWLRRNKIAIGLLVDK